MRAEPRLRRNSMEQNPTRLVTLTAVSVGLNLFYLASLKERLRKQEADFAIVQNCPRRPCSIPLNPWIGNE